MLRSLVATNLRIKNYFASLDLPRHLSSTICYYYQVWSDLPREPQQLACNNGVKRLCTVVLLLYRLSIVPLFTMISLHTDILTHPQHVGRRPDCINLWNVPSRVSHSIAITMRLAVQCFFVLFTIVRCKSLVLSRNNIRFFVNTVCLGVGQNKVIPVTTEVILVWYNVKNIFNLVCDVSSLYYPFVLFCSSPWTSMASVEDYRQDKRMKFCSTR